ncbi:T9SS type A sorting domain-containing protein [candidate division KSB1 bacterium]
MLPDSAKFATTVGQNSPTTFTGIKRVGRFKIEAIGLSDSSVISIDNSIIENRQTRMIKKDLTSEEFDIRRKIYINVAAVVNVDNNTIYDYKLSQNYPNPFNPQTTIRFELPKTSDVEIVIFDVLGREVKTLLSQYMPVGSHTQIWDGTDKFGARVASGMYIYRIQAGNYIASRKMILLK